MIKIFKSPKTTQLLLVTLSILFLSIFWHSFYTPIWNGQRHIGWDMDGYNYPLDNYLYTQVQQNHKVPQLDPFIFNGEDFVGNFQAAIFYPVKAVWMFAKLLLHTPLTFVQYQKFYLFQVLLLSVLVFLVALKYFKSYIAALLLALTATYNGFMQAQLEHIWFFLSVPWIPIIFLGLVEGVLKGKKLGIVYYVAGMVCMILAGYPLEFITVCTALIFGLLVYVLIRKDHYPIKKILLRLAIPSIFVLLISSVQLLPGSHDILLSVATVFQSNLPAHSSLTLLLPNHFGHLTGPLTQPWERTTTYFYIGGPLIVGSIAWVFVLLSKKTRLQVNGPFAIILASIIVLSFILTFSTLLSFIYTHITHIVGYFRPWIIAIVMIGGLSVFVVYPISLLSKLNRALKVSMVLVLILFTINLRSNMPAFFNTATGTAKEISLNNSPPANPEVSHKLQNLDYSTLVNQSTIGGYWDNWPRIWGIRSLGGHDPVLPKSYGANLAFGSVSNAGERLAITSPPNLEWLRNNGVMYYIDTPASEASLFDKNNSLNLVDAEPSYGIWQIGQSSKIFNASPDCINNITYSYKGDTFKIKYDALRNDCSLNATVNYSQWWHTDIGRITAKKNNLGFTITNLASGNHTITLRYVNNLFEIGKYISLGSLVIFSVFLWKVKDLFR